MLRSYRADEQGEHVQWPEMSHLLHKSAKWTKSKKRKSGTEGVAAADTISPPAVVQQQQVQGSKRRRSAQQQPRNAEAGADDEDADMAEGDASGDSDYERVHALASAARAAAGVPDGRHKRGGQQQQQQRGITGRKQQATQRRHAQDESSEPDQDEDGSEQEQATAAAAADEAEQLAGQEGEEADEEEEEVEEQYTAEQYEAMLAEDANEVVAVRSKGLAGHLKSVQVQNFMCHQNFAMDFGTHVNVVSGSNGSGKSAVLQAMQCALGAQARKTGRADKNSELVRTGCSEAKVQVTLWNTGEDAYQHHVYGDHLTVERVIKVSGGSKWRLLNHAGAKVSDRKKDLDELLDHLNVDATNPLAVMTQDTSRNFLCGSVADKKKYDLFMQATMLEQMQANLHRAQGFVDQMKEAEKDISAEHSKRKARVVETREKLSRLEASAGLVAQMKTFERAQNWAAVQERMGVAEALRQRIEVELPEGQAGCEGLLKDTESSMATLREKEESLTAASTQYQAASEDFTAEMRRLGEELKAARLDHRTRGRASKQAEARLHALQEDLRTLLESKKESNDDRQREYAAKLQEHQGQRAGAGQNQLLEQKQAKEDELRGAKQRLASAQQSMASLQQEQQQLRAANGQKLALFGQHAQLRVLVDRSRRAFERVSLGEGGSPSSPVGGSAPTALPSALRVNNVPFFDLVAQLPIGPIGAHLTLANEMWNVATEVVLGGTLETWLVHNRRDKETLFKLAGQARMRRPTVIEANFDRPPYSIPAARQVPQGWATLRQFVQVEHPHYAHIIDNKLMDMSHYECVVVDQEEQRCKYAVYERAAGPNVGRAVHVAGRSWTRSGDATITKNYFNERRPRVGASFDAHLRSLEQALQAQQGAVHNLQQQVAALDGEVRQLARLAEQQRRELAQMVAQRMRANRHYTQLQTQAPVMDAGGDDDGEGDLAEQQRGLQEQVGQAQIAHDRAKAELEHGSLMQEQAQQLYDSRKAEMDEMLVAMTSRQEELQAVAQQRGQLQGVLDGCKAHLQKLEAEAAAKRADADQVARQIQELKQEALSVHGGTEEEGWAALAAARDALRGALVDGLRRRIAAGRLERLSEEELQQQAAEAYRDSIMQREWVHFKKKADELHRRVALAEQDAGGNRDELQHKLAKAEAEWRRHEPSVRNMRQVVRMTDRAVDERWDKFHELFDNVSSTVSGKFLAYMHRRGHMGKVRVDQASGELRLLVKVNVQGQGAAARKSQPVRDLKQLSGGERSFTTVAFILALGEFTESPFRAMDEFDVFMDAINRRIATQTLLEFAREKGDLQFIFLTPQDLQAVEDAKRKLAEGRGGRALPDGFVKVVQMRPARAS
ncbi:hypothetical protein COO60DRAFT_1700367 [Scenedesmus sp. NREL 46B-D3]|nr:hypothetical protein COO60DRAFT_1700367 [Scenedesmus sp. NREL 46B-D3]